MYCELQRDWTREATVPGFMDVLKSFDGFNPEKAAHAATCSQGDQRTCLLDVAAKCPIQPVLEGTSTIVTKAGTPFDEAFDTCPPLFANPTP
ncbi:hypothetical protein M529_05055 [Sphingobium ummariense RL-3]|uniref:Uncharacterized protein n=1 Tax=Sphingobium ummariense RL-3 TaxID=1346791 RepID=T0KIR6_9SPHN|nr:hypothetical protein M529_05055 [Sphingobium ummariense RL-3]